MVKSVLSGLARRLGEGVLSLIGTLVGIILLAAPFIVYAGGELSLRIGTYIGAAGILIAIVTAPCGIFRRARGIVCVMMYICAFAVSIWLWVWSILYVGATWGMMTVFFANLFLGIGVMALAVLDALLHAQWHSLGEFIGLWVVMIIISIVGGLLGSSAEEATSQIA